MRYVLLVAVLIPATCLCAGKAAKLPVLPDGLSSCDVELNVTDPDPQGLNVRSSPASSATVVGVLKPDGDWTSVHATGQRGDWLSIDHAETIDDNAKGGSRTVFDKIGWVHVSKLGVSELATGSGTMLRDKPAAVGKVLLRIKDEDSAPTQVLSCQGKYIKVRHGKLEGWTDTWCNNERTTCS